MGEAYYALMNDTTIHYATEAGGLVGHIDDPNAEGCKFDMIIEELISTATFLSTQMKYRGHVKLVLVNSVQLTM